MVTSRRTSCLFDAVLEEDQGADNAESNEADNPLIRAARLVSVAIVPVGVIVAVTVGFLSVELDLAFQVDGLDGVSDEGARQQ